MDSFTAKLLAFALPTLGVVFSGQHPDFLAGAAKADKAPAATTLKIVDQEPSPAVDKLGDEVEAYLEAGSSPESSGQSAELRIATRKPWLASREGQIEFMKRLPDVEARPAAPPTLVKEETRQRQPKPTGFRSLDRSDDKATQQVQRLPGVAQTSVQPPVVQRRPFVVQRHQADERTAVAATPRVATSLLSDFYRDFAKPRASRRLPEVEQDENCEVIDVPKPIESPARTSVASKKPAQRGTTKSLPKVARFLIPKINTKAIASSATIESTVATPIAQQPSIRKQIAETPTTNRSTARVELSSDSPSEPRLERSEAAGIGQPSVAVLVTAQESRAAASVDQGQVPVISVSAFKKKGGEPKSTSSTKRVPPQTQQEDSQADAGASEPDESAPDGSVADVDRPTERSTAAVPVQREAKQAPAFTASVAELAANRPRSAAASTQKPEGWSPIDIRNLDVDATAMDEARPAPMKATYEDKIQAEATLAQAFELIQRQAPYSARARLVEVMRVVAQSLDEQSRSTSHTAALNRAITAYDEANDFFPVANRPGDKVNLPLVLGGHETTLLAGADPNKITPRQCLKEYLAYAEQEFATAVAKEPLASQALYGLGRLESAVETTDANAPQVRTHRALTLYQTALIVDDTNFAAANELGVLLAKYGKYEQAVDALELSVRSSSQTTSWKNLANIYRKMGRYEDAQVAERTANENLARQPKVPFVAPKPRVEWVDAEEFAAVAADVADVQVAPQQPATKSVPARPPVKTATKARFWPFSRGK